MKEQIIQILRGEKCGARKKDFNEMRENDARKKEAISGKVKDTYAEREIERRRVKINKKD